jgi:hypothetical protein
MKGFLSLRIHFADGVNNDLELHELEQLYNLPRYLQERTLIFVAGKYSRNGLPGPGLESPGAIGLSCFSGRMNGCFLIICLPSPAGGTLRKRN